VEEDLLITLDSQAEYSTLDSALVDLGFHSIFNTADVPNHYINPKERVAVHVSLGRNPGQYMLIIGYFPREIAMFKTGTYSHNLYTK
jgi:hypothetical protein